MKGVSVPRTAVPFAGCGSMGIFGYPGVRGSGLHSEHQAGVATRTPGRCLRRGTCFDRSFTRVSRPARIHRRTRSRVLPLELGLRRANVGVQPHEEFRGSHRPLRVTDDGLERSDTGRSGRGQLFDECARAST